MMVEQQFISTEREKANLRPISGTYVELAKAIRSLLGYDPSSGRSFLTDRNAALKTGINHVSIGTLIKGGRASRETLITIARSFGADPIELLKLGGYDTDVEDPLSRIGTDVDVAPIANFPHSPSSVTAGVRSPIEDDRGAETLGAKLPADVRTISVVGDCMRPYFAPGDILFVRPAETAENGNKVVAVLDDDTITCKVFRQDDGAAWLEASNGTYQRIDSGFRIVGVVVKVLKDV